MARLIVRKGPAAGRIIEVVDELSVGRESAGLVLDDPEVSRRHAVIRVAGGKLEIDDAGSLNGTWVNGARIESATLLGHGDRIEIGDSVLDVDDVVSRGTVVRGPNGSAAAGAPARTVDPGADRPVVDTPALGSFSSPSAAAPTKRRVATRRVTPVVLSLAAIAGTAAALLAYFAGR